MELPFAERLDRLAEIMATYDTKTEQKALRLPLVKKKWYLKEHVGHIMDKASSLL